MVLGRILRTYHPILHNMASWGRSPLWISIRGHGSYSRLNRVSLLLLGICVLDNPALTRWSTTVGWKIGLLYKANWAMWANMDRYCLVDDPYRLMTTTTGLDGSMSYLATRSGMNNNLNTKIGFN